MDLRKMISELQAEKSRLDEAIQALERLSAGKRHRRGRRPRWMADEVKHSSNPGENREETSSAAAS